MLLLRFFCALLGFAIGEGQRPGSDQYCPRQGASVSAFVLLRLLAGRVLRLSGLQYSILPQLLVVVCYHIATSLLDKYVFLVYTLCILIKEGYFMSRISVSIPDSDLITIDNFLSSSSSGLCPSSRSEFFRWSALRFIRQIEGNRKAIFE